MTHMMLQPQDDNTSKWKKFQTSFDSDGDLGFK